MNLIKKPNQWDAFDVLDELQGDLNRAFKRSLTGSRWGESFNPEIEVREESDRFIVRER